MGTTTKAAPPKLTDPQRKTLEAIRTAGDDGFTPAGTDKRAVPKLMDLKLVKAGAKDKQTGAVSYKLSAAGAKYLDKPPPA